jgi:hypothetical protein
MTVQKARVTSSAIGFGEITKNGLQVSSYENLSNYNDPFFKRIKSSKNEIATEITTIPLDHLFFYKIYQLKVTDKTTDNTVVAYEQGIAKLVKNAKKIYLERKSHHISYENVSGKLEPLNGFGEDSFYEFKNEDYLIVTSYVPTTFLETLCLENSVLCTIESHNPCPVQIDENCVLGRKDNLLQSIDKYELKQILDDQIAVGLSEYAGPLPLATKSLAVSSDSEIRSPKIVMLACERPRKPLAGTLIFNTSSKKLELFDGSVWRVLATEE